MAAFFLIFNLGILAFFKYQGFLLGAVNDFFGIQLPILEIALPIGISFYTFQTMSYTIDVYRGEIKAQRNFIDFGMFVSLFPQLIAGPIVKYKDIDQEIDDRKVTVDMFALGIKRFVVGLAKKVLLANNIGFIWHEIQQVPTTEYSVLLAWIGIIAFALQIYFDFSGYSDMAIGLALMFGFRFPENFNYPYISKSITEFWRRWHISLGSWFREYVYIPLGGNRVSKAKQVRNILLVWFLTGFWHGASWNFILWGLYFGVILLVEKLVIGKYLERLPSVLQHGYAIILILFGWVLFAFEDMSKMKDYVGYLIGQGVPWVNETAMYYVNSDIIILLIGLVAATPIASTFLFQEKTVPKEIGVRLVMAALLLVSVTYLVDATFNPFIYFRF